MADTDSLWKPVNREAAELRGMSRRTRLARVLALLFVVVGSLDVVSTNAAQAAGFSEGIAVMRLVRLAPGAAVPTHDHPAGEELFVLDGGCDDDHGSYAAGSWVRYPPGSRHALTSKQGCTLYVKAGHMGG